MAADEAFKLAAKVESWDSRAVIRAERATSEGVVGRACSSEAISVSEVWREGVVSSRSFFSVWRRSRSWFECQYCLHKVRDAYKMYSYLLRALDPQFLGRLGRGLGRRQRWRI